MSLVFLTFGASVWVVAPGWCFKPFGFRLRVLDFGIPGPLTVAALLASGCEGVRAETARSDDRQIPSHADFRMNCNYSKPHKVGNRIKAK